MQLESSMCDEDRDESFIDKNSIAEFEMLEKECINEEIVSDVCNNISSLLPKQMTTLELSKA